MVAEPLRADDRRGAGPGRGRARPGCGARAASQSGNRFEAPQPNLLDRPVMAKIFNRGELLDVA
jgi:hypothetical protein